MMWLISIHDVAYYHISIHGNQCLNFKTNVQGDRIKRYTKQYKKSQLCGRYILLLGFFPPKYSYTGYYVCTE